MNSNIVPSVQKSSGFTLIEVLVASFILFLVLAAITMVYRGALLSSQKAERTLTFASLVAPICERVRIEIQTSNQDNQMEGQGIMGEVAFTWTAIPILQAKSPKQFNPSTGEVDSGPNIYKFWDVSLQLKLKSATRNYQFNEVSW